MHSSVYTASCAICLLCVESLLVVASVGVQLTTTFASGRQTAMFYDIADISSIVINEAVTMVSCAMLSQLLSYWTIDNTCVSHECCH